MTDIHVLRNIDRYTEIRIEQKGVLSACCYVVARKLHHHIINEIHQRGKYHYEKFLLSPSLIRNTFITASLAQWLEHLAGNQRTWVRVPDEIFELFVFLIFLL